MPGSGTHRGKKSEICWGPPLRGASDSAGGMVSDGASTWGSTKMEPSGTANPGDEGTPRAGTEATGDMDGLEVKEGGMRAPAPKLPPPRQDILGAGVVTPPEERHGGLRAPETRLPQKGTRVAPQIFTEARDRDVGTHRRNVPWSPEDVLIDTVARLQRDFG